MQPVKVQQLDFAPALTSKYKVVSRFIIALILSGDGLEWDTVYGCDIPWNQMSIGHIRLDPVKMA